MGIGGYIFPYVLDLLYVTKLHPRPQKERPWGKGDQVSGRPIFKPVPFLPLYFNCPSFTPDDYTFKKWDGVKDEKV